MRTHEAEPREDQVEGLVDELDVDPELAHEGVRRAINVVKVNGTVDRGEERAVQPPAPLRHQLRNLDQRIRSKRRQIGGADVKD